MWDDDQEDEFGEPDDFDANATYCEECGGAIPEENYTGGHPICSDCADDFMNEDY